MAGASFEEAVLGARRMRAAWLYLQETDPNWANELRSKGAIVDCNFSMKKIKKSLHEANESGAKFAILLYPEELKQEKVVIRDMQLREQKPINITDLISSAGQAASWACAWRARGGRTGGRAGRRIPTGHPPRSPRSGIAPSSNPA